MEQHENPYSEIKIEAKLEKQEFACGSSRRVHANGFSHCDIKGSVFHPLDFFTTVAYNVFDNELITKIKATIKNNDNMDK